MPLALILVGFRGDGLALSRTQEVSAAYAYDLVGWHLGNSHSKWTHWLRRSVTGFSVSDSERLRMVSLYFNLGEEVRRVSFQIETVSAGSSR